MNSAPEPKDGNKHSTRSPSPSPDASTRQHEPQPHTKNLTSPPGGNATRSQHATSPSRGSALHHDQYRWPVPRSQTDAPRGAWGVVPPSNKHTPLPPAAARSEATSTGGRSCAITLARLGGFGGSPPQAINTVPGSPNPPTECSLPPFPTTRHRARSPSSEPGTSRAAPLPYSRNASLP